MNKPESYIPDPILYMDGKENATSETKSPGSKKRKSKKKRDELEIERQFGKDLINEIAPLSSNGQTSKTRTEEARSRLTSP